MGFVVDAEVKGVEIFPLLVVLGNIREHFQDDFFAELEHSSGGSLGDEIVFDCLLLGCLDVLIRPD